MSGVRQRRRRRPARLRADPAATLALAAVRRRRGGGEPPWAHDYPTADIHLMKILKELTLAAPRVDGSNVFTLDDPELFDYPIAYMSEPGFWTMTDEEGDGLRNYLMKGGFIIFDDFRDNDWYNLEEQMKRVLPEARWIELDRPTTGLQLVLRDQGPSTSAIREGPPTSGMFEDNDPKKRLIAIANGHNDLGEYWEFSDTGMIRSTSRTRRTSSA